MNRPRKRRASKLDQVLDLITDEELPEYRVHLQQLAIAIQHDEELAKLAEGLSLVAITLAFLAIDPRVKRTVSDMCKVADCNRTTYYLNKANPKWVQLKTRLARQFTEDIYPEAIVSLTQLVKLGDVKALRLFFELRGDLVQRSEATVVTETAEERMKRVRAQEAIKAGRPAGDAPAPPANSTQEECME